MPNYCSNCGESLGSSSTKKGETRKTARRAYEPVKKKRKASAYNKRYAREYRRLKKKPAAAKDLKLSKPSSRASTTDGTLSKRWN